LLLVCDAKKLSRSKQVSENQIFRKAGVKNVAKVKSHAAKLNHETATTHQTNQEAQSARTTQQESRHALFLERRKL
jgi:hypothetical protein